MPFSSSMATSSRSERRPRYPASLSSCPVGPARPPLFGMAMRSMIPLKVGVDVVERQPLGHHEHLKVVEELGDFQGRGVVGFVLCRHPHLGGFLDDLLADGMDPRVKQRHRARTCGSGLGLGGELGEQLLKGFHASPSYSVAPMVSVTTCSRATGASMRPTWAMNSFICAHSSRSGTPHPDPGSPYRGMVRSTTARMISSCSDVRVPGMCARAASTARAGSATISST